MKQEQKQTSVFITGNSRSGTTMMSRILGNHDEIVTFQELHFFDELLPAGKANAPIDKTSAIQLFSTLCAIQRNGYFGSRNFKPFIKEAEVIINQNEIKHYMDVYAAFLFSETNRLKGTIPCEQTPQNIFSLDEIFKHLTAPKVIVMVRDPREVLLSQKNKWKRRELSGGAIPFWESVRSRLNYHPITISKIWNSVMKTAGLYSNHPNVIFVKYEDLISDPVKETMRVCNHLQIEYSEKMIDIPVTGSSNFADSNITRGIDSTKTRQWENGGLSSTEIYLCQEINQTIMKSYGYKLKNADPVWLQLLWFQISMPFRLGLALILNLKRLKHPLKIMKRIGG